MIKTAVGRPVAIMMLFAGLVLIGGLAFKRLPVDLLPAINYPNLTVITNYADTPADDLARLVTQPLEEVITGLAGVRRVISRTREGVSTITVQYEWGTEMDFANLHLREAIDRVAFRDDFPEDADRPLILRWDPGARPIAILVLGGDDALAGMTDFAREVVKPAMEQIQGISQAEVIRPFRPPTSASPEAEYVAAPCIFPFASSVSSRASMRSDKRRSPLRGRGSPSVTWPRSWTRLRSPRGLHCSAARKSSRSISTRRSAPTPSRPRRKWTRSWIS
jgi:hypothetical protein